MNKLVAVAAYGSDSENDDDTPAAGGENGVSTILADITSSTIHNLADSESDQLSTQTITCGHPIPEVVNVEVIARLNEYADMKLNKKFDLATSISSKKEFSNPNILSKAVGYFDIDEIGSNYPPEVFNPHNLNFDTDNVTAITATIATSGSAPNLLQLSQQAIPGGILPTESNLLRSASSSNINLASTSIHLQQPGCHSGISGGTTTVAYEKTRNPSSSSGMTISALPSFQTFTNSATGVKRKSRFA